MVRYRILPYKQGSKSAKALAEKLGGKILRLEGSSYKPREGDIVINWGNSNPSLVHWPVGHPSQILNLPNSIRQASDKLTFFQVMQQECSNVIPQFWTSSEDIPADAYPIVCRTILSGHSGAGIVLARTPEEVVPCQLYVKYQKKKDEYRVHLGKRIVDGTGATVVVAVQRKARRLDCTDPNWEIRNHSNGFVYTREGFEAPQCVIESAISSFDASGLDFGAVDVIYNEKQNRAYVLEINTAPGLEGQTVEDYAKFFKGDIQ